MSTEKPQLHVVFSTSAATSMREAFAELGRNDIVVSPGDNFSFGPIEPDDAETRARWVETELGYSGFDEFTKESSAVVAASHAAERPPIAWLSPDIAGCAAGFLWWLSHMEDRECLIVEAPMLPLIPPARIAALLGREIPLSREKRAIYLAHWNKLKSENAPLRVLTDDLSLISATFDFFDGDLLAETRPEWKKMAWVVGAALYLQDERRIYQSGDFVLAARLRALAEAGIIEYRGDLADIHRCEVRIRS